MTNLLLLNNFYTVTFRTDEFEKEKKATNYTVYGSVTRYGPRTGCQHEGLTSENFCVPNCNIFLSFKYIFTVISDPGKTNDKFIAS